jgi:hypothetical protein
MHLQVLLVDSAGLEPLERKQRKGKKQNEERQNKIEKIKNINRATCTRKPLHASQHNGFEISSSPWGVGRLSLRRACMVCR